MLPEAEILAVGVPEFTLRKANFALVVAVPPIRRSVVELTGLSAPFAKFQYIVPAKLEGFSHENVPEPFVDKTYPFVPSAEGHVYATPPSVVVPDTVRPPDTSSADAGLDVPIPTFPPV